ncbi:hypothetical protein [Comamonas suwonensis]|uniref:hypothetical protein n=1 Tax=Comamonas suwonensis TaxID=2606214 RepID=UPI00145D4EAB|nr:hypothetical protein [Comamonas suwonensis]MBI1625157.1 hypothetical protein [Comamonas suwonensis]
MSTRAITHLAAALIAGAGVWYFQAARLGADLADERLQASQYREQIADERTAAARRVLAVERKVNDKYQGALNDAIKKQAAMQAAADRARSERDGLRKQLSDAEQRLADASPTACIEYASTLSRVFGQCSQRYTELAIRADGHAADAATCRAAWPVIQIKENPQ